jgi:hypothetical protein
LPDVSEMLSWLANSEEHLVNRPAASSKPVVALICGGAIFEIINSHLKNHCGSFRRARLTMIYTTMAALLRKYGEEGPRSSSSRTLDCVIPAWSAGIQVDMDVSGGILASLDAGNPCRHDEDLYLHVRLASVSS